MPPVLAQTYISSSKNGGKFWSNKINIAEALKLTPVLAATHIRGCGEKSRVAALTLQVAFTAAKFCSRFASANARSRSLIAEKSILSQRNLPRLCSCKSEVVAEKCTRAAANMDLRLCEFSTPLQLAKFCSYKSRIVATTANGAHIPAVNSTSPVPILTDTASLPTLSRYAEALASESPAMSWSHPSVCHLCEYVSAVRGDSVVWAVVRPSPGHKRCC